MSFAGGTRYDSPLRLCRDIKIRGRMPDRLPYVSTIDSTLPSTVFVDFLRLSYVEGRFNGGRVKYASAARVEQSSALVDLASAELAAAAPLFGH